MFWPFHLVMFYIVGYRKQVVLKNIENSFPNKTPVEHKKIMSDFYLFLNHLFAESVKNLSIKAPELQQRVKVKNPELMQELFEKDKDVLLLSSHYNNWELLITAQNLVFEHKAIGIGMPLSNSFWDKKLNQKRERFGMHVVNSKNYKSVLNTYKDTPTCTLILGDQSPSNIQNVFWTQFLNQTSAFYFGAEIMANQMNAAVVYASIQSEKRGHYSIELKLITAQPKQKPYGYITQQYIASLEQDIQTSPSRWLWSHKRWKIKTPEDVLDLKKNHQLRFEEKFRPKIVEKNII